MIETGVYSACCPYLMLARPAPSVPGTGPPTSSDVMMVRGIIPPPSIELSVDAGRERSTRCCCCDVEVVAMGGKPSM